MATGTAPSAASRTRRPRTTAPSAARCSSRRRAARRRWRSRPSRPRSSGRRSSRSSASTGPALVVRSGGGRAGETFLLEGDETTIGRSPDCDIFLDDVTVSRRHAVVRRSGGALEIEDLGSLNGTFLNRKRIESPARSRDGDELQIGKYRLTFLAMTTAPAHRAARAAADDRRRLRAAEGRVPGHLDLEDPLPRGRGPRHAAAHARRLPALRRGGARAARDDPPAPARRVPAAEGDPRGAREADVARAAPPARARASATPRTSSTRRRSASAPASTAGSRASSRSTGCSRRASTAASAATARATPRSRRSAAGSPASASRRGTCARSARPSTARRGCSRPRSRPRSARGTRSGGSRGRATCRRSASSRRSCRSACSGAASAAWSRKLPRVELKEKIREVPDWPQPGVGFKDVTPLLADPEALDADDHGARRVGEASGSPT